MTLRLRRRSIIPLALLVSLTLAGCGGGSPSPGPAATSAPTVGATPSDSADPTSAPDAPAVVAGFELSGTALIEVDVDGDPIRSLPIADPAAVIASLTAFHGTPYTGDAGCGITTAVWPDVNGSLVVAYSAGGGGHPLVMVGDAGYSVRPSAGPGIGEPALAFAGTLPASQYVPDYAYVYDAVTTGSDGTAIGGVAFLDGAGAVVSLVSPSPPYGTDFC